MITKKFNQKDLRQYINMPISLTFGVFFFQVIFVFVLFDLILYVPSTISQLYRDGSSWA